MQIIVTNLEMHVILTLIAVTLHQVGYENV